MATVLRSSLIDILLAIRQRLVDNLSLDDNEVRIIGHWPEYPTIGDTIISLWPREWERDIVVSDGSGRRSTAIRRNIWIIVDCRLAVDPISDDQAWLTDTEFGIIQNEDMILNSLMEFLPIDSTGNSYTIEPMKIVAGMPEDKITAFDRETPPVGWGRVVMTGQVYFQQALDQSWE